MVRYALVMTAAGALPAEKRMTFIERIAARLRTALQGLIHTVA
jgi:hypothetical protein